MAVTQLFSRGARLFPDRVCLADGQRQATYRKVHDRVARIAARLRPDGASAGEKCAVLSPNTASAMECLLGIQWAGAVYVPLNPKNAVADNIAIATNCDVSTLFFHSAFALDVARVRADCTGIRHVVCIDREWPDAPHLETWIDGVEGWPEPAPMTPDTVAAIYSTGGTTGLPKGVMLTSLNWDVAAANFHAATPCAKPPVFLSVTPITHAAGTFSLMLMALGGKTVILPAFDAAAVLDAIEREQVTHVYLPPTAIYMLLEHPTVRQRDYSSLEYFMYTSAPMSVAKLETCLEVFGPVMVQFWGQTEAPSFCTFLAREDHRVDDERARRRLASCGRPMLLTPVAAMSDDGRLLPSGETGELVVRGPLVMAGYYNNPAATAEVSAGGWHHTGDVGHVDEDGYVYIVDRKKEMIITGGYNVYPREVEARMLAHPAVQECAVVGVPDEKWGEAVKAVVELKPGHDALPDELVAWCKAELGSVKTPKSVEVWPELPRTAVGKLDKKVVRQRYWQGLQRAI